MNKSQNLEIKNRFKYNQQFMTCKEREKSNSDFINKFNKKRQNN